MPTWGCKKKFTGFCRTPRWGRLHNLADCLVLPSVPTLTWQEQFGMVLVEAMACRKPILAHVLAPSRKSRPAPACCIPQATGASWPPTWRACWTIRPCVHNWETGYRRVCERYTKQHTARQYEAALLRLLAAG